MVSRTLSGPTIILIGGEVTLDSGAQLDTRRQIAGDEWDFTLRAALGGSEGFWHRAKELTDIILDQSGYENPWAFAWVDKTIKAPKADGTFTRVRTVRFLDHADHLMDRSLLIDNVKIDTRNLMSRYRIMPYFLRFDDIVTDKGPAVFVGAFHTTYEEGSDIIGLRPLADVLHRWPDTTLVLPHTPLVEKKAIGLLEWHRKGTEQPERDKWDSVGLAEHTHPKESQAFVIAYEAAEELRRAGPHIIDHDLRITFWADRGEIKDPADLDAALTFVKSRYDLDFGLWDLARDEVLRSSLLEPEEQRQPAQSPAPIPEELAEAVEDHVRERQQSTEAETSARREVHEIIWPVLEQAGWSALSGKDPGTEYRLAVGPEVKSPYWEDQTVPIVYFALTVHKKQAKLNLIAYTRTNVTEAFLESHAAEIEQLTGTSPEAETFTVLRLPDRGWDGVRDGWRHDLEVTLSSVEVFRPNLRKVIDAALSFHEEQLERSTPIEIEIPIEVEVAESNSGEQGNGKGLWDKLLGR